MLVAMWVHCVPSASCPRAVHDSSCDSSYDSPYDSSYYSPAGSLLDHAGGYVDPLRVISQLPPELAVPRLRSRLVKVIADFRTSQSLQQVKSAALDIRNIKSMYNCVHAESSHS